MGYRCCTRCVMTNFGDTTIKFDKDGICNYCADAYSSMSTRYKPNAEGKAFLDRVFSELKERRKSFKYDCMLGLSGGLDSSYAAYICYLYGLRVLAVHIDDGLDAPVTTTNVKKICDAYGVDLIIEKPNATLFGDLTCSFIRAGVPNIAIPQDNVLFASLYKYAKENKIDCFINGSNFALESILQRGNTYDASDKVHLLAIWKKFGKKYDPKGLPLMSMFEKHFYYRYLHKIQTIKPLNYVEYNAKNALETLQKTCGFECYGDKHCESIFTKLMQRYYLPQKFSVDKRTSHYSSMIVSGQMTREEALERLKEPLYAPGELDKDVVFVLEKIGMSRSEFDQIMKQPPHEHTEYPVSILSHKYIPVILKLRKHFLGY